MSLVPYEKATPARPKPRRPPAVSRGASAGLGRYASAATVIGLQRLAGNSAVAASLRDRQPTTVHAVQRCGDEVHEGCPCAAEAAAGAEASDLHAPVVQRACPTTRPAGEEASSKTSAGVLSPDVSFDRKTNKVTIADFPVSGASPPGGVTTEPDWERAMSVIAGTPSVGPIVGIFGFSDCLGPESHNNPLRQKRADAVLALMPPVPKAKVMLTRGEFGGNFLVGNDTAEQRARNRAVVVDILEPIGPKRTDACDMLAAASDLDQYFFLVRCLEKRLGLTTVTDAPKVLSVLRQIYYGSANWTLPSGRHPVWDDVVTVRPWSPGADPGPMLGKKLFDALKASQTIKHNGKDIDVGHLLTGMDAARKPDTVTASAGPFRLGTNVQNHEWATWAGDVGSAAAMSVMCTSFLTFPTNDARYFTGGASDQDLDGDIDAYAMWAALNEGTPDAALRLDMTVSDALMDYYRTTSTNAGKGRASRYEVFVNFYGGQAKGGVIGKPAELHAQLLPSVREFALLYFGNDLKSTLKSGTVPAYCAGTPAPVPPGRTVEFGRLLADVADAADKMTALFVEWLKKRV
jgi:hypothetical protein